MEWKELKRLIQSIKPADFEKFVATLLTSFFKISFVVARSGDQPSGDAISVSGDVSMQAKQYTGKRNPNAKTVEGDIRQVIRELPRFQVYVLAVSRDTAQLRGTLDSVAEETGLDIVILELSDDLSDLGALCVTFWEDIREFFDFSKSGRNQEFLAWVKKVRDDSETKVRIKELRLKLEYGLQTQNHVQNNTKEYLLKRFSTDKGFNPINLSQTIERKSLESEIINWWGTQGVPVCYLEGEEGMGKSWLASKAVSAICEDKNIVTFWLDSKDWESCESLYGMLKACLNLIYPPPEREKVPKLQDKIVKVWTQPTLIVLDGVNELGALEAAKRILDEYFTHRGELENRIRFLLTSRPLDAYRNFEHNLWEGCHKISIEPFNDTELQNALTQENLQPNDLPNSLKDIAKIPRYFRTCIQLRELFHTFDNVTKEMVLWADLLYKIKHNLQVRQKIDWQSIEDAQDILAKLATESKWANVNDAPKASVELLEKCFSNNYQEIRRDLEEQRIALKAGKIQAELSKDHIVLGWALHISNLFDSTSFSGIERLFERFKQELEPMPSEDHRSKALFLALQITAIPPEPDIPQDQLSQKRAALMLAWFHNHNAEITDKQLSFWAEEAPDAYAQVVEFEFEYHNSPNYEDALIAPLAKTWLNKKGDLNRLASRLTKWIFPTDTDNVTENVDYANREGHAFPTMYYTRNRLLAAALSILSQRPERQFLEKLAHCYENSTGKAQFKEDIGRLMRWGYTEEVLGDLYWLAELVQHDEILLRGVYGLAYELKMVNLPLLLQRSLSKKELETRAFVEQHNRRFKPYIDRIRSQERLLIGDSPSANGNYHGLDNLAVRTDLPDLHYEDLVEIKKILHGVSVDAKLGWSAGSTLEDSCIENLMPWVAKYDSKSYAKLACSLKLNTLNQQWAQFKLCSIQGLIFEPEDCTKITEAILEMKQRLIQDIQADNSSSNTIYLTSLLTETLLFCAPEEKLTDWFNFLASHEPLRKSICYEPLPYLLEKLLPESIVALAQQKLETLGPIPSANRPLPNEESEELPEQEYWSLLYAFGPQTDEELAIWSLEELKLRKPDLTTGTFLLLSLALSDPKRFLDEILTNKKVRKHLFRENSRRLTVPIYKGKDVPSYATLVPLLPQEIVGSFLCSPDRHDNLSRWGKELMERMFSILQGNKVNLNSAKELRFTANQEVLKIWAEQDTTIFLQLANEYLTQLSKFPQYSQVLSDFTDAIRCLLLRFQPDKAKLYYHQWNAETFKTVYRTHYGVLTFLAQLWKVEYFNSPEHRQFRRELLEKCLNDEEIMFMTLAALIEGGQEELWSLVIQEYIKSPYAKTRNLGVSILPWFGNDKAIEELEKLKSEDSSQWVRGHAEWAYEVAQQERNCRQVYREALQTRDLFRISAAFEQIKPALSPIAKWWHCRIEEDEQLYEESQNTDPKLLALIHRFWYRWGDSSKTESDIEVFRRKLSEYCRGEKFSAGLTPRIAPWWKPDFSSDSS